MTIEYPFSLAQLAQILSALENERRNPNTKRNAIKAIERNAAQIGLSAEDVFDAADGLLSGRLSAAEFRSQLRDEGCGPASFVIEAPAEPAPNDAADDLAQAYPMPNAGPLAVAESGSDDNTAADVAEAAEDAQVAAAAVAANPTRAGARQQLLAACQAAEHWLQAELDSPGETRADDILRVLRAAIERAQGQSRRARGDQSKPPRADSKQARLIAMLHRGASISQMTRELGWLRHTCHGALAGLKKKRSLEIISDKHTDGERIYRLAAPATPAEAAGNDA
jgi:hypothetical protein